MLTFIGVTSRRQATGRRRLISGPQGRPVPQSPQYRVVIASLTPEGDRVAWRVDEAAAALGRVRVGAEVAVVDAELEVGAWRHPVTAGGSGRLEDSLIRERAVGEEELGRVDHEALPAADDHPGDDYAAGA